MTPDQAATLIDLYSRAAEAFRRDDLATGVPLVDQAEAVCAGLRASPPDERALEITLLTQCDEVRREAEAELLAARQRLLRVAQHELRSDHAGRAYGQSGVPDARFIDRTG